MKRLFTVLFFALLLVLTACGSSDGTKPKDSKAAKIIEDTKKAHAELDTIYVTYDEGNDDFRHESFREMDMKNNLVRVDTQLNGMIYYADAEHNYFEGPEIPEEQREREHTFAALVLEEFEKISENPFHVFERMIDDLENHMTVDEKDGMYILTYAPTEEEFTAQFQEFAKRSIQADDLIIEMPEYDEYRIQIMIDKETNLVQGTELVEYYTYSVEGQEFPQQRKTFTKDYRYNEALDITIPESAVVIE
ncbi:DUF6612 family protein [Savagea faecisuis]|uniref:DUF6612 family protein n=1 Tax=Savagea faecisuis TaxID=1274803 RepID=A0ABW3H0E1_9BACL